MTLADVAARAGVSASTASLAFSGSGPVSDATKERVLAAAAELGYGGPDPRARSLRRSASSRARPTAWDARPPRLPCR